MKELFLWQVVGDSLKIGSWIVSFVMASKAMIKLFIFTEILFLFMLIFYTHIFSGLFGFEGVSIAYLINYALYWIVISFFVFEELERE